MNRISIHVPRVGDDMCSTEIKEVMPYISIHVPRVGDDLRSCAASPTV